MDHRPLARKTMMRLTLNGIDGFDFELTADQLATIDALDTGRRGGWEPEDVAFPAFSREIPEA